MTLDVHVAELRADYFLIEALYPIFSMTPTSFSGEVFSGSYSTIARRSSKLTSALTTPAVRLSMAEMPEAHDPQYMPEIVRTVWAGRGVAKLAVAIRKRRRAERMRAR